MSRQRSWKATGFGKEVVAVSGVEPPPQERQGGHHRRLDLPQLKNQLQRPTMQLPLQTLPLLFCQPEFPDTLKQSLATRKRHPGRHCQETVYHSFMVVSSSLAVAMPVVTGGRMFRLA